MSINVLEILENSYKKTPNKIAINDGETLVSYADLIQNAKQIGSLISLHCKAKQPVMVLVNRSVLTHKAYLGVLYAGCYFAPADVNEPLERIQYLIDYIKPCMILTVNNRKSNDIQYDGPIINIKEAEEIVVNEGELDSRINRTIDTEPMCVMFTSGSTGNPKGVVLSHRSMINRASAYSKSIRICENSIVGNPTPLQNVSALHCLFATFYQSATIIFIPQGILFNPVSLFDFINENEISNLWLTPTSISYCAKEDVFEKTTLKTVKAISFAGSTPNCTHLNIWLENLPDVAFIHRLGSTEVGPYLSYDIPQSIKNIKVLPVGIPDANVDVFLLDGDNNLVDTGEIGEICVKGSSLAMGYYNNTKMTEERFIQNPLNLNYPEVIYKTGDMGSLNEDGMILFHGRMDRLVKCKGHRVELDEVDAAVRTMPEIDNCCSLYNKEEDHICLFYSGEVISADIIKHIRKRLPGFMMPQKVIRLDAIPMINPGKVDYKRLNQMMESDNGLE